MLDWFSDIYSQITSEYTEHNSKGELLEFLKESLDECQGLYLYAAELGKTNLPADKQAGFKSEILELYKGLLIKTFVDIGSADRVWSREEVEMSTVLFEHLWGTKPNLKSAEKAIFKLAEQANQLSWEDLLKPFREIEALQQEHAELENLILRIANLLAKANGVVNKSELRRLDILTNEIRYALTHNSDRPKNSSESSRSNQKDQPINPEEREELLKSSMEELSQLVGLEEVKKEINNLVDFLKIQKERENHGIPRTEISLHMIFCGNPGTGKTTVARIIGHILSGLNFLEQGHTVETDRSGLVAGYAGQTGIKTGELIDQAINGVLFVDEAYSLSSEEANDVFGDEAIQVLLKRMEDERDRLVVILAGYPEPMKSMIKSNPGLSSRFQRTFSFPDYDAESMLKILNSMCVKHHYRYTKSAKKVLLEGFHEMWVKRDSHFGNGRYVRNVFEKAIRHMSSRLVQTTPLTKELLTTLVDDDFEFLNPNSK